MASGSELPHGSTPLTAFTALATVPRTAVAAAAMRDGSFDGACRDVRLDAVDLAATFLRAVVDVEGRAVDFLVARGAVVFLAVARFAVLDVVDFRAALRAPPRPRFDAAPFVAERRVAFFAAFFFVPFFAVFLLARFAKSLLLLDAVHAGMPG